MEFQILQSGSNGNCSRISTEHTSLLIDAGISKKKIVDSFSAFDPSLSTLSGILITHGHSDHVGGLIIFEKEFPVPIYCTKETMEGILREDKDKVLSPHRFNILESDSFTIGDFSIHTIPTYHDTKGSVSYKVEASDKRVGILTDTGKTDSLMEDFFGDCDALLLESNHDIRMLELGPYPYPLKRRILSEYGHLSNEDALDFLRNIRKERLKHLFLGHISKENNMPELVEMSMKNFLKEIGEGVFREDFSYHIASRTEKSETIYL